MYCFSYLWHPLNKSRAKTVESHGYFHSEAMARVIDDSRKWIKEENFIEQEKEGHTI
jgi:hypothetical protein